MSALLLLRLLVAVAGNLFSSEGGLNSLLKKEKRFRKGIRKENRMDQVETYHAQISLEAEEDLVPPH